MFKYLLIFFIIMPIPFKQPLRYEFVNKGRWLVKKDFEPDESNRVIRDLVDRIVSCSSKYGLKAESREGEQSSKTGRLEEASVTTQQFFAHITYVPPDKGKKGAVRVSLTLGEGPNVNYAASLTGLLETYKP